MTADVLPLRLSVKIEYPPIYDRIAARFGLAKLDNVKPIFAWDNSILNPHNVEIGPELHAHERVHCMRQNGDPHGWWNEYLASDKFRLEEEIPAHAAEYLVMVSAAPARSQRRQLIRHLAGRLRHPMYGYYPALSEDKALALLKTALRDGVA